MRREDLQAALAPIGFIRRIYYFEEIGSTSDWAKELIRRSGPAADLDGTIVVTDHQTAGRGRMHRRWQAPSDKALLFSVIVNRPDSTQWLPLAGPVATCEAIRGHTGEPVRVKYPNDILLNGRKISGILLESTGTGASTHHVLGIGVNVTQTDTDLPSRTHIPASSLMLETGNPLELPPLLARIMQRFEHYLQPRYRKTLPDRMNVLCDTVGQLIEIRTHERTIYGQALAIRADGALVVRTDAGFQCSVYSGDVVQIKPKAESS